jgi:predicted SAM-dependent methyltransferase
MEHRLPVDQSRHQEETVVGDDHEGNTMENCHGGSRAESQRTDFYSANIRFAMPRRVIKRVIKKVLLKLLPNHLLEQLNFELHMLLVRLRSANRFRAYLEKKDLLLNVGAGGFGKEGWINLDAFPGTKIDCQWDARKRLPFASGSIKGIFSEHFFEHIDYTEEAPRFLRECYRVLRKGGVLRIIVPDAEKYLMAYAHGGWREFRSLRPLDDQMRDQQYGWTYNTRMELINYVFRQGQEHKFAYDFETIEFLLKRNGFQDVRKQEYGKSVMREICIDAEIRRTESLYVESIK